MANVKTTTEVKYGVSIVEGVSHVTEVRRYVHGNREGELVGVSVSPSEVNGWRATSLEDARSIAEFTGGFVVAHTVEIVVTKTSHRVGVDDEQ